MGYFSACLRSGFQTGGPVRCLHNRRRIRQGLEGRRHCAARFFWKLQGCGEGCGQKSFACTAGCPENRFCAVDKKKQFRSTESIDSGAIRWSGIQKRKRNHLPGNSFRYFKRANSCQELLGHPAGGKSGCQSGKSVGWYGQLCRVASGQSRQICVEHVLCVSKPGWRASTSH